MSTRNAIRILALGLALAAISACAPIPAASPTPQPTTAPAETATVAATTTGTATVAATETAVTTPTTTDDASPTPTPAVADGTATPTPAATATGITPTATAGTAGPVESNNLFAAILRDRSAPEGWTVAPCEGDGPFLCVQKGEEVVGAAQLSIYPIETMPDFQRMLAQAGVPEGPAALEPSSRDELANALNEFVEAYHEAIETDRQVEYGSSVKYERLPNAPTPGGPAWLRYGFRGVNEDGSTFERWVSYVGYDGDLMYILVASYRPEAIPTFRSDAELTEFLPYLDVVVAGLQLPLPVAETATRSVRSLKTLEIFRSYSAEAGNPVGQVAAGETVTVTGVSPMGRHWRIACPDPKMLNCWIAGTSDATSPPGPLP